MIKDVNTMKKMGFTPLSEMCQHRGCTTQDTSLRGMKQELEKFCPRCREVGINSTLKFYWMNYKSGIWMCSRSECVYPLDSLALTKHLEDDLDINSSHSNSSRRKPTLLKPKCAVNDSIEASFYGSQSSSGSYSKERSNSFNSESSGPVRSTSDGVEVAPKWTTYPLWENRNSLCWLDVTLTLFLTNITMYSFVKRLSNKNSMLWNLADLYSRVQDAYNESKDYRSSKVQPCLEDMRQVTLTFLKDKNVTTGEPQSSPVFALQLLLRDDVKLKEEFCQTCIVKSKCKDCGNMEETRCQRFILPVPLSSKRFRFPANMGYTSRCNNCQSSSQKSRIHLAKSRRPAMVMLQFPDGIDSEVFERSLPIDRRRNGGFVLTQIVQYTSAHFVCWSRNLREDKWLRADDLQDYVAAYCFPSPACKPIEVFMMVWERLPPIKKAVTDNDSNDIRDKKSASYESNVPSRDCVSPWLQDAAVETTPNLEVAGGPASKTRNIVRYEPYVPKRGIVQRNVKSSVLSESKFLSNGYSCTTKLKREYESESTPHSSDPCVDKDNSSHATRSVGRDLSLSHDFLKRDDSTFDIGSPSMSPNNIDIQSELSSECSSDPLQSHGKTDGSLCAQYDSAYSSPQSSLFIGSICEDPFENMIRQDPPKEQNTEEVIEEPKADFFADLISSFDIPQGSGNEGVSPTEGNEFSGSSTGLVEALEFADLEYC